MAALSKYDKQRIVFLKERGLRNCSNNEAWRSCARYVESRSIARRQGSGTPTLCTGALLQTIDNIIQADDEATAVHTHSACCRETRSCYYSAWFCVPDANWARRTEGQRTANSFVRQTKRNTLNGLVLTFMTILKDVLWTDESSVQLQCYKRFCCRKGKQPCPKPRAKHPIKVHVWAGIGWHGATEICIIDGIMDAAMYVRILQVALQPTLQRPQYEKGIIWILGQQ